MTITLSRRVAGPEDLQRPGDYAGPLPELEGPDLTPSGRTAVLVVPDGPGIARLVSPPWEFTEQEDGTLAIAEAKANALAPGLG